MKKKKKKRIEKTHKKMNSAIVLNPWMIRV